ncbi:hypothetical protein CRG98_033432 [Punica granatum]|uniref:Uncharacterized protein n=1 Tax=Punica granatum TaxID=22663 RepID=A0A2I0IQ87_PUNGR|nr:hypothetical protein CRG98_033432 [Punica granatum]
MRKQAPDEGFPVDGVVVGGEISSCIGMMDLGGEEALAAAMEEEGIGAVSEGLVLVLVDRAANSAGAPEQQQCEEQRRQWRDKDGVFATYRIREDPVNGCLDQAGSFQSPKPTARIADPPGRNMRNIPHEASPILSEPIEWIIVKW